MTERVRSRGRGWTDIALVLGCALAAAGCPPQTPSERTEPEQLADHDRAASGEGPVVASVNGESVTRHDFDRRVDELPRYVRARYQSESAEQKLLAAVAQFEALADVAEQRGLGTAPGVASAVRGELARAMVEHRLEEELASESGAITDGDVESYYENNLDEFRRPERRRILVVATTDKSRAKRIRGRILANSERGEDRISTFRKRAANLSVDPISRSRGGSIGWLEPPDRESDHPEVAEVVYGLDARGELSEVFRHDEWWYVATWSKRDDGTTESLGQVAGDIRRTLRERRRREIRRSLVEEERSSTSVGGRKAVREKLRSPGAERRTRRDQIPIRTVDRSRTGDASEQREDER